MFVKPNYFVFFYIVLLILQIDVKVQKVGVLDITILNSFVSKS